MKQSDPSALYYHTSALRVSLGVVFSLVAFSGIAVDLEAQSGIEGVGVRLRLARDRFPMSLVPQGLTLWSELLRPAQEASRFVENARIAILRARTERWRIRAFRFPDEEITDLFDPELPPPGPGSIGPPSFRSADLNVELSARLESQLDRLRNLNCTEEDLSNPSSGCRGGFPTPSVMQEFALRAGGVVAERLHVNVDFDSKREFSASNTIKVWYQGREDEILQRLEVGNLNFQLPASRFIRSAVPANAFGLQGEAQFGPVLMRAIVAQEKGSAVRARVFNVGDDATQTISRESRDTEFEASRFFTVIHPALLPAYPSIDVLNVDPTALPPALQIAQVRVYRLRAQSGQVGSNPSLQGINAVALRDDSPQRVGPFFWDLLIEGRDYYLDPSGLWFGLNRRASADEFLAVSYVTALGDTVGTYPAVSGGADTLFLVHEPRRGPEVPTFFHELKNFYRIGGQVERNSIALSIVINESERPLDGVGTYLSRLGVATVTDLSALDEFNRVFPRERDPRGGDPINDFFLVFPHLTPFADSARFQPDERNDSLYQTPTYLRSTEGAAPRFRLLWQYQATGTGDRSRVNLGVLQVVEGSERIRVGNRDLVRGRDYDISYDLGNITFRNPDSLFAGPTQVLVQFEENQMFDTAPSSVVGVQATYDLQSRGRVDAMAVFRNESSVFTRPRLGFEPEALFVGGISSELQFQPNWITDVLDHLPFISTDVPSTLTISGEVAMSRPDPNQNRQAYVEEFEGRSARTIELLAHRFQSGSMPSSGVAVPASHVGANGDFFSGNAATLVWQNQIDLAGQALTVVPEEIDSTIVLTGSLRPVETLLWMTLKPAIEGIPNPLDGRPRWRASRDPGPRWRSITQPLDESGLGVDLSRVEFLEFWVLEDLRPRALSQQPILVFDFGTVFEDAEVFGPSSFRVVASDTAFFGKQRLGVGTLDSEKDPFTNVFNATLNDVGIHRDLLANVVNENTGLSVVNLPTCEQAFAGVTIPSFPLGDLNARCTRKNGFVDSEDLNGDNRLDLNLGLQQEELVRFVVPLGDPRFLVRNGNVMNDIVGTDRTWRLYRIPFRRDTVMIGAPNLRQIRALRVTVASSDRGGAEEPISFALARMQLVGAPWLKRAATPIAGLAGFDGLPHGEVQASVISTADQDLGYVSPPGVLNEADRRGVARELGSEQINERSLRLLATDLRAGERAEAYLRFADEADKNFLKYRTLRLWVRGRGSGWEAGDLEFFIKVGSDENNFYLYRVGANSSQWEPEVLIDINRWLALRTVAERVWLNGNPPNGSGRCGGDSSAYVACDGPYLVHVRDPGVRPPNLARVSEIAVGMIRTTESVFIPTAEVWVDDIRLSEVVADIGLAANFEARLYAADVADVMVSHVRTDDRFRTLDEAPDYVGEVETHVAATFRADRILPRSWGMSIPVTVERRTADSDPLFLGRTDVRADALSNHRLSGTSATSYQVALRRTRRGETRVERLLVDPVSIVMTSSNSNYSTELSSASLQSRRVRFNYDQRPSPQTLSGAPQFIVRFFEKLPPWIRDSEFGRGVRTSRLRLNPFRVFYVSELVDNSASRFTYRVPVRLAADSALVPFKSIDHVWRNVMGVDLRPYASFSVRLDYTSVRDLQDYGDTTQVGRLIGERRDSLLGTDVGFERDRSMNARVNFSPLFASWFRPRAIFQSRFSFHRDPDGRQAVPIPTDSGITFRVPEAVGNVRRDLFGATIDLRQLARVFGGEEAGIAAIFAGLLPADVAYEKNRRSAFDRVLETPGFKYQFGFGTFDQFRQLKSILARSAVETTSWTVSGGVRLPLGFGLRMNFRKNVTGTVALRSESQAEILQRSLEWPSGLVTWAYSPPSFIRRIISSVTAQMRFRLAVASTHQPNDLYSEGGPTAIGAEVVTGTQPVGVFTETKTFTMAPHVTITWAGGVVTTGEYARREGKAFTSGTLADNSETTWGGTMHLRFRAPEFLSPTPRDIRSSATMRFTDAFLCLQRSGVAECVVVADSRRREFSMQMDTAFPPNMRGGANVRYVFDEQRHTSTKSSRFIFSIFLDINFLASQVR